MISVSSRPWPATETRGAIDRGGAALGHHADGGAARRALVTAAEIVLAAEALAVDDGTVARPDGSRCSRASSMSFRAPACWPSRCGMADPERLHALVDRLVAQGRSIAERRGIELEVRGRGRAWRRSPVGGARRLGGQARRPSAACVPAAWPAARPTTRCLFARAGVPALMLFVPSRMASAIRPTSSRSPSSSRPASGSPTSCSRGGPRRRPPRRPRTIGAPRRSRR